MTQTDRRAQALAAFEILETCTVDKVTSNLNGFFEELIEIGLRFAFWGLSRPDIDLKTRELGTVAVLTAMGNAAD